MNKQQLFTNMAAAVIILFAALCGVGVQAQTTALLKRTTYKTEKIDLGAGGTVSITGAPKGSVSIEGWQQNEVEISAEIEVQAATEADLKTLAAVNDFIIDDTPNHIRIISVGTNDKGYIKRTAKNLPKNLLAMPFRIDYKIKVPIYCDVDVDGGDGDLSVAGIDGALTINFLKTNARLDLVGGSINAIFGEGAAAVTIPARNWRGRYADVQLTKGEMIVNLPPALNAEVSAEVLRTGKIENSFAGLKPRERKIKFTDKSIFAKSGSGGVTLKFTVGDGNLKIVETEKLK